MSNDSKQKEQNIIDDHRNMLMVSKKISNFQETNLKSWAFVFFENVEKSEVSWNFIKDNEDEEFYAGKVVFNIVFQKGTKVDSKIAQTGIDRLIASTKLLFWKETEVEVKRNGKKWTVKK